MRLRRKLFHGQQDDKVIGAKVNATGRGATMGVLFKNAEAIETMRKINTLVVDKTGTDVAMESAGVLYPFLGILLSPIIAAAAMSISSVSVVGNALRLQRVKIT